MIVDLSGKTAIVTGGASNIGRSISIALAEAGATVVIFDRDGDQAARTAGVRPDRMSYIALDLMDEGALERAVAEVASRGNGIDILVSNAGWVNTVAFAEKSPSEMEFELRLNLHVPISLTRLVLPAMIERKGGRIVYISSDAARGGQRGQAVYSAAKGGILGLTRTLAQELGGHGITVNAITPAMIVPQSADDIGAGSMQNARNRPPEMMAKIIRSYPVGRVGSGADIAYAVTFLCAGQASFITGQTLPVNGGFLTI